MKFLDPVELARLRNLRFDLRRHRVEGQLPGRHRSVRHGFASEFAEHRPYAAGDELKRLDWKVYARKDRFFIKEFQEEKALGSYLLLDASGSMAFRGRGPEPKWELACRLAAGLAYLVLAEGDAAGLVPFDTEPRGPISPRQGFAQLEAIDRALASARPGGETSLPRVLKSAVGLVRRRSVVFLVSDLLGDARAVLETVKAFRARKHQVLVLQVLDPMERDLDLDGPVLFEGLEDGARLRCDVPSLRGAYRAGFERQQRLYGASFHSSGIPFDTFYTDQPWHPRLARLLAAGGA